MTKQEIQTRLDSFQQLFVKSDDDLIPAAQTSDKIEILAGEPGSKERIQTYAEMASQGKDLPTMNQ